MTDTYGILGWPVEHSRSPVMQNAAFRATGVPGQYVRFAVPPERLADAVRGLTALGVAGANVTLPHKEAVLALLDDVTPEARALGAVNTLVRDGDRWCGHNTDAPGLARSLIEGGATLDGAEVLILGAGGAARAAVVGMAQHGARRVRIAARRGEQARTLVAQLQPVAGACVLEPCDANALQGPLSDTSLLVQATSATLEGAPDAQAFADNLPLHALPQSACVTDLVYSPLRTTVLQAAEERGLRTIDGTGMLVHQGALAFELWTGQPAPVTAMRDALWGSLQ